MPPFAPAGQGPGSAAAAPAGHQYGATSTPPAAATPAIQPNSRLKNPNIPAISKQNPFYALFYPEHTPRADNAPQSPDGSGLSPLDELRSSRKSLLPPVRHPYLLAGSFLTPVLIFFLTFAATTSHTQHTNPTSISWILRTLWVFLVLYLWRLTYFYRLNRVSKKKWRLIYLALNVGAFFFGQRRGDSLYWTYSYGWYTYSDLANYISVDPSTAKGQSFMDAGRIEFKAGVRVAAESSRLFKVGRWQVVSGTWLMGLSGRWDYIETVCS